MASLTRNDIKDIKSLQTKKGRKAKKQFLAEGVRVLEEAHRHRIRPVLVLIDHSALSPRGRTLVGRWVKQGVDVKEVSSRVLTQVTEAKTAQGIVAVFAISQPDNSELTGGNGRRVVWCDSVADPGNLGTLMRSALAFGFERIVLTGSSADPYAPKVVRSSAGCIFGLKLHCDVPEDIMQQAREAGVTIVAADPKGDSMPANLPPALASDRLWLALGSEAHGISAPLKAAADYRWRLEQRSAVESLNVAVAGSILMYRCYQSFQE
jgi:TrmH family RNA methyltransferase